MADLSGTTAVSELNNHRGSWFSDSHTEDSLPKVTGSGRSSLESSLDTFFTKAKQYAYATVIRRLDPVQPKNDTTHHLCSPCLGALWRGHPIQEELLRACHSYTSQWLSERDTSWLVSRLPAVGLAAVNKHTLVQDESSLIEAVGAWSLEVERGSARDIFLSSSRVDTVPRNQINPDDVKTYTLSSNPRTGEPKARHRAQADGQSSQKVPTLHHNIEAPRVQDVSMTKLGNRSDTSKSSDKTNTESELAFINEHVENLLPELISSIRRRVDRQYGNTSTPGSSFESNGHGNSQNSLLPFNEQVSRQGSRNFQKRKRGDDNDDRGGESENDGDAPAPRTPNPMPLNDLSARLACHFHTFDRFKYCDRGENGKQYKTCGTGFRDSRDLRDHLKKKHCGPKYLCSRCHTEFRDATDKAAHEQRAVRCEKSANEFYEEERYILIGTKRRLTFDAMKKPRCTSHEEYWLDTWSVIFPFYPFPTTPYMPQDAFDVMFGRIAEEEIQNCVSARRRDRSLNFDEEEEARYIRTFVSRIHARLREEFEAGRLCHDDTTREAGNVMAHGAGMETHDHRADQAQIDGRQVPQSTFSTSTVDHSSSTILPPHEHYTHSNWRDPMHGHSHQATGSYNLPNRAQPDGDNDPGIDFNIHLLDPASPAYDPFHTHFFPGSYMNFDSTG